MDGYVSKPISREKLFKEIKKIINGQPEVTAADNPDGPGMEAPNENLIDRECAMELVDGDRELLKEMVEIFLDDCPKLLNNIRNAIEEQNSDLLEREAHSIKGAVGVFFAGQATETAFRLEKIGNSGELSMAEEAYRELEREIERLKPELNELVKV